jgi:hypothetical protein
VKFWQSTKLHPTDGNDLELLGDVLSESDESDDAKAAR